jgi:WD40 repeat protein
LTCGQDLVELKTRFSVLKISPIPLACIHRTKICSSLAVAPGKSYKFIKSDHEINNLFIKKQNNREIGIFDMRYTATNAVAVPVVSFPEASKRINGASFSPITGNFALTTGADDTITLYDVQKGNSEPECKIESNFYQS